MIPASLVRLDPAQHAERLVLASRGDQMAGRLRHGERREGEHCGRNDLGQKHPTPRLQMEPERRAHSPGCLRDQVVAEQRREDADDDTELLERGEPAPDARRRDFRDVGGRNDARGADGDSGQEAREREEGVGPRESGRRRRDCKEDGRQDHRHAAPQPIGQTARDERADRTAEQDRGDLESGPEARRVEAHLDSRHRTVDHRAVESEKEPAERSRRREKRHVPDVDPRTGSAGVRARHRLLRSVSSFSHRRGASTAVDSRVVRRF